MLRFDAILRGFDAAPRGELTHIPSLAFRVTCGGDWSRLPVNDS